MDPRPHDSITLEPARPEDAGAIARMSRDLIEPGLGWTWRAARVVRALERPTCRGVIAREGRAMVAFGLIEIVDDRAHLLLFAVDPTRRRQGIGRRVLAWLEALARGAGARAITLEVRTQAEPARAFYAREGFELVRVVRGYYQGREDAARLIKRLDEAAEVDIADAALDPVASIIARALAADPAPDS